MQDLLQVSQKQLISCVKEGFPQVPLLSADTMRHTWFIWNFIAVIQKGPKSILMEMLLMSGLPSHTSILLCKIVILHNNKTVVMWLLSPSLSVSSLFTLILCSLSYAVLDGARARPKCPTQRYNHFSCFFSRYASLHFSSLCYPPLSYIGPKWTKRAFIIWNDYKNILQKLWLFIDLFGFSLSAAFKCSQL